MSVHAPSEDSAPPSPAISRTLPQGVAVRTILITDLVASTKVSEELGDQRLAEVSAAHDRMARDLFASYEGLEIDKADGFLLLFERPIDAVGCALAYHQGVARLSEEVGVELAARSGIHLGEVHLRHNPPDDVARGAKPVEVEGLAKPLASRVMSLATGRQTLVTQSAFDLARRAADDRSLGEEVRWVAHGQYLLEGVAEPVDIFEIGLADFAPLTSPLDSEKARRATAGAELVLGWRPATGQPLPDRRHWVMVHKLGEGSFGEVWLAEHAKTGERHTFKFCYEAESLKALEREVTFFRLMKDALGNRRDIVRVLDWNFEEAPYYLESEYTEGGDLAAWAEDQGGLDQVPLATRIELVAQVAEALGAAHSVGILHKDVKPANVLITAGRAGEPRARLTDFGVGLLTDQAALVEHGITLRGLTVDDAVGYSSAGTHLYMAPEVIEGQVPTIQADLYSLGVLVYQMVVGDFSRALAGGWQRHVDDEVLRDDVACFVDGSPRRRPGNASEIADRLRRLEERRAARREAERARLQAEEARLALERGRRRRRLLIVAVTVLALFGATMATLMRRARLEAERANREATTARQVSEFLEGLFERVDPGETGGGSLTAREILDQGARRIETELLGQPVIQSRLMNVMGVVYRHLGLYETAEGLIERALAQRRERYGSEHVEVAESLYDLGRLRFDQGRHETAEELLRSALAQRRELLGERHLDTAETSCELSNVLTVLGEVAEAEALGLECLTVRRELLGEPHDKVAETLFTLAVLEHYRDAAAAEKLYREALAMYEGLFGELHPAVGEVLNNYASLLMIRGDSAAAEPLFRRSLEIKRRVLPAGHPFIGISEINLAAAVDAQGGHAEAEALARSAEAILSASYGPDHWRPAIARGVLGASLAGQGELERAEALLTESYLAIDRQLGDEFDYRRQALERLVALYETWQRPDEVAKYRALLDGGDER